MEIFVETCPGAQASSPAKKVLRKYRYLQIHRNQHSI